MPSTKSAINRPLPDIAAARRLAPARAVVRSWRALTANGPSRRTLIACSGGADSVALTLSLAGATDDLVVAHIVHDMRPEPMALADRDAVRGLADRLGLEFMEAAVSCREGGNIEAAARRARYRALATLAADAQAPFVATAHHADDQFESMVMALLRGAGPRGLAGVAPSRSLAPGRTLIRPMLRITRRDAEALCAAAGERWATDATNLDPSRARAALRHGPLEDIAKRRPGAAQRAARSADLLRDAALVVEQRVVEVFADASVWPRAALRAETALVVGAGLRRAALRLSEGAGADRLGARVVDPVVRAIRDRSTEPRRFTWPLNGSSLEVQVRAQQVALHAGREG